MQERTIRIGEGKDQASLVFNLNVMADIQEAYGSVNDWVQLLEDVPQPQLDDDGNAVLDKDGKIVMVLQRAGEPDMQAFLFGFAAMINEGVEIENETLPADQQKAPFTKRQVGRLITKWGKDEVANAMKSAITSATDTGESSKNE